MPLSDGPAPESKLGGHAHNLDQLLGAKPVSPEDRIKIAGMLLAGAIRKYIVSRALTGKPLNWRERAQVIDGALNDTKRFLRSRFIRDGQYEDDPPLPVLGGTAPTARDDDPVHEVDEDRLGFGIEKEE